MCDSFIKCFYPILLCFILSCLHILNWKALLIQLTVTKVFNDRSDDERNKA